MADKPKKKRELVPRQKAFIKALASGMRIGNEKSRLVGCDHRAMSQILGGLRADRNFVAEDRCKPV